MEKLIVWDTTWFFDLYYINQFNLFNFSDFDIEIRKQSDEPQDMPNAIGKKVIIVDWSSGRGSQFDYSWADLIIVVTTEQIPPTYPANENKPWTYFFPTAVEQYNNSNIIFIAGGVRIYDINLPNERVLSPDFNFFKNVVLANEPIDYTQHMTQRPFLFDALLGSKKPSRIWIFKKINEYKLLDKSFVNLTDNPWTDEFKYSIPEYRSPWLDDYDDPNIVIYKSKNDHDPVKKYLANFLDVHYSNSRFPIQAGTLIPHKVFQNSWFSIVTETMENHSYHFFTEKTAKAIFGKRIFVCMSSRGFLQKLRQYGYKTFNGIIDENYDKEPDSVKRLEKVWQQIEFLANSDPVKLYQQAHDILEHNYKRITDLNYDFTRIKNFIHFHLQRLK